MNKNREKYLTAFLIAFGVCMLCFLPVMILNGGRFFYYGDFNKQQVTFYTHMTDLVRSGSLSAWDWLADLGSDTASSFSFYLLGSPFFWLMSLFPSSLAVSLLPVFIALKSGIAAVGAYGYTRLFVKSKNAALIASVLFGLSAYNSANVLFNHFHDAVLMLPFMLWALERLIREGRHVFFAVTVAIAAFTSYYFFFGQVIFLLIYFAAGLVTGHFRLTPRRFGALVFEAVAGTLMAAVLLLPSAMSVIGNPRLSSTLSGLDLFVYPEGSTYLFILKNLLLLPDITLLNNFGMTTAQSSGCFAGGLCFFSLCGVIAYFRAVKGRDFFKVILCICAVMMFVPVLNQSFSMFNSLFYGRWFYMPTLIGAAVTAKAADMWLDGGCELRKGFIPSAVLTGAAAAVSLAVTLLSQNGVLSLGFDNYAFALVQPVFSLTALAFLGMVILKEPEGGREAALKTLLIRSVVFAAAGMCMTVWSAYIFRGTSESGTMNSVFDYRDSSDRLTPGDNFFRTSTEANLQNMPTVWGLPTLRYFNSTVEPSIMSFYDTLGIPRSVKSDPDITDYPLMTLLSVRYYIDGAYFDADGNALPAAKVISGTQDTFTLMYQKNDLNFYENSEFLPMGFAFDSYTTNEALEGQPALMKEFACLEALVLDGEQISRYSDILTRYDPAGLSDAGSRYKEAVSKLRARSCTGFKAEGSSFSAGISLDKPGLVFFSVPYSEGWSAQVNGEAALIEKVDNGLMAVKCGAGESSIVFTYKNRYLTAGLIITLSAAGLLAVYAAVCIYKHKKHSAETAR